MRSNLLSIPRDGGSVPVGIHRATPPQYAPATMDRTEAAAYVGVSPKTWLEIVEADGIPYRKVGRRYLFSRVIVDRWLEGEKFTANVTAEHVTDKASVEKVTE
jgi:excisionase family DNA binding protein